MRRNSLYTLIFLFLVNILLRTVEALRPNFVVIVADDLGSGEVNQQNLKYSFMLDGIQPVANRILNTPNLERLAKASTIYKYTWGATVCVPSRASFLTGLIPSLSNVRGNIDASRGYITLNKITFPLAMQKLGYATVGSQKYGLGRANTNSSALRMGFNQSLIFETHVEAHDPFAKNQRKNGVIVVYKKNSVVNRAKCLKQDACVSTEDASLAFTLEMITTYAQQKIPFIVFDMPISPHVGIYHPRLGMTSPVNSYEGLPNKWNVDDRGHGAMVIKLDKRVGAILDKLEELNITDDTVVGFFGDNGPECPYYNFRPYCNRDFFTSSGGRRDHKRSMYEGGLNIPAMIKWNSHIPAGVKSNAPWLLSDLGLTILKIAGAPQQLLNEFAGDNANMQGASKAIDELWTKGDSYMPKRDYLITENCEGDESSCTFAVLDIRNWKQSLPKLVFNGPKTGLELFDLIKDPQETQDLSQIPEQQQTVRDMYSIWQNNRIPRLTA